MEKDELKRKIYSKIDELPTLPVVVPKLLGLVEDTNSNTADVTEVISRDPALTSKILKVANSAYYGFSQRIADLERAVALLGFNMVKSLALSIGVMRSLPGENNASGFSQKDLWLHSVAVATVIKEMGKRFGKKDNYEYLFIIGLLHDMGMIILDQFFGELFQKVFEELRISDNEEFYMTERRIIGSDHGEAGAMLLKRWKFPEEISCPVAVHHVEELPEDVNTLDVAMLRTADALSHELDPEIENDGRVLPLCCDEDLDVLGMSKKNLEDMKLYLHDEEGGINAFFNAMT